MSTARSLHSEDKTSEYISLLPFIDPTQVNCLNESSLHSIKAIALPGAPSSDYLESDADEQLLINLTFNQTVRVSSLVLHTIYPTTGPKTVQLAVNKPNLGFSDFDDGDRTSTAQTLEFTKDSLADRKPMALRFVRFQNVKVLSIFVQCNHSDSPTTRIDKIDILGVPVQTTKDLSELKKTDD